jgi:methylated-DNA-protein-cysteine methyltransferase related protein
MGRPAVKKSGRTRVRKSRSACQALGPSFRASHQTSSEIRVQALADTIRFIPCGKVASYGQVAAAAGYPRYHRAVARLLKTTIPGELPWHRVLGAGGEIKLAGRAAAEQRLRLKMEGVAFAGKRVDLNLHQHVFDVD